MPAGRLSRLNTAAAACTAALCLGCAATRAPLVDAFPLGSLAAPWTLQGPVWSGTFEAAAPGLGDDADTWRRFEPQSAWLAVYCHETQTQRCLKVRCISFGSADGARRAFKELRPLDIKSLHAGDEGCWTEVGVLYRWGRLVFDIFGDDASWGSQVQASYLAAIINQRIPPGAPDDPR